MPYWANPILDRYLVQHDSPPAVDDGDVPPRPGGVPAKDAKELRDRARHSPTFIFFPFAFVESRIPHLPVSRHDSPVPLPHRALERVGGGAAVERAGDRTERGFFFERRVWQQLQLLWFALRELPAGDVSLPVRFVLAITTELVARECDDEAWARRALDPLQLNQVLLRIPEQDHPGGKVPYLHQVQLSRGEVPAAG